LIVENSSLQFKEIYRGSGTEYKTTTLAPSQYRFRVSTHDDHLSSPVAYFPEDININSVFLAPSQIINADKLLPLFHRILPPKTSTLRLVHDSTRGIAAVNFDQAVKNRSHILTVIRATNGYIFGGYVADKFGTPGSWVSGSNKNYIFTLGNVSGRTAKIFKSPSCGNQGIHITSCGLHMGADLVAFCSHSCTVSTYTTVGKGFEGVTVDGTLIAGTTTWVPDRMEVYQCEFEDDDADGNDEDADETEDATKPKKGRRKNKAGKRAAVLDDL